MQWYEGNNRQTFKNAAGQQSGFRRFFRPGCMAPILGLTVIAGLCAFAAMIVVPTATYLSMRPSGVSIASLPALTPTSLPTLTPTASAMEAAMVLAPAESQPGQTGAIAAPNGSAAPATGGIAPQSNVPVAGNPATGGAYGPAGSGVAANRAALSTPLPTPTPPPPVGAPGNEVVIILPPTVPPTVTPTPRPLFTPTPLPPTATPLPTPLPPDNGGGDGGDAEEEDQSADNWSFTGVRTDSSQLQNGMLVYGNLVNHTGTPQDIQQVSATFYNAQGDVIGQNHTIQAYWPGYTVPAHDASMPFQLLVNGLSGAADFELTLDANSSSNQPREDFTFSDVKAMNEGDAYCLDGRVRNSGGPLQEYLIITAVLYDKRDYVINFQDEQVRNPTKIVGDQSYHFKICVAPPFGGVVRYDLKAWGN